jgi:hypothetical protein
MFSSLKIKIQIETVFRNLLGCFFAFIGQSGSGRDKRLPGAEAAPHPTHLLNNT